MDPRKLAALARKNAKKEAKPPKEKLRRQYDDTLPAETEEDSEQRKFFSDMKKREF